MRTVDENNIRAMVNVNDIELKIELKIELESMVEAARRRERAIHARESANYRYLELAREAAEKRAEALRIENERLAKEAAEKAAADRKLAEEKRKADDVQHRRNVNQEAMNGLVAAGLNEKQAQAVIISIVGGLVKHVSVNY